METTKLTVNFSKGTPYDTYFYLSTANILAANYFKIHKHVDASDMMSRLKDKKANCVVMANATFSTYIDLIKKSHNMKYIDSARMVSGYYIDTIGIIGHQWIEYKLNGEWIPFETTQWTGKTDIWLEQDITSRLNIDLSINKEKYIPYVYTSVSQKLKPRKRLNWGHVMNDPDLSRFYTANKKIL
jgi:hypothetical protein